MQREVESAQRGQGDWRTRGRARKADADGYVERDGVRIFYETFGTGQPTVLMLPTWSVLHAAHGRFQVADLARHYRVVTFDGRGNGRSDRPRGRHAYTGHEFVADAVAVLDATGTDRAVAIACSLATHWLVRLAAEHPDRVLGAVASGTNLPLEPPVPAVDDLVPFDEPYRSTEGWAKFNAAYWRDNYEDFLRFFFAQVWTEPYSDKVIDDCVAWGLETTPETLADTVGANPMTEAEALDLISRIRCPMLVIHGADDAVTPVERSVRLAEAARADLVILDGAGHCSGNRDPVRFDLLVREFVDALAPPRPRTRRWTRAARRPRRVLFVPPGSGLGTIRRDLAIAAALRTVRPGVLIEWLAAPPARMTLEERGERIHPASDALASEADALDLAGGEHELNRFAAWREMDEALFVNFMVLDDVAAQEHLDLVVADGARQVDHHLHENPELKRFAYAWLADSVGWLPAPEGGDREARLTASANAEMAWQIGRYPRVRDRSIFLGTVEDLPLAALGPGLPSIRDWASASLTCTGPIVGLDPGEIEGRAALRRALGWTADERVWIVTAGGTGLGAALIRRSIEAFAFARKHEPSLRLVVVAGPRLDPSALPAGEGVEARGYEPELHRLLAACDLAIVHGGLATTTELVSLGRPLLWLPFRNDSEQRHHVAHRLRRYGAPTALEYATTSGEALAMAALDAMRRPVHYRRLPEDGAVRAAALLAELV